MNRIVVVVVVVAMVLAAAGVGVLALTSGSDGDSTDSPAPSDDTSETSDAAEPVDPSVTEPPDPALADFYAQEPDWEACEGLDDFECATVTVPVDYRDPGGETIDLALNRLPAGDPDAAIGPLVVNPGGPGAPGTDFVEQADFAFPERLLDRFDLVGFDPRGTGDSAPVDCFTDDELTAYLAGDPDPDTPAEVRQYAATQRSFFAGCVELSGPVVGHVTTIETARDLDVIRSALRQEALAYFGASYGTKLGATYAELFPDRVGRLVLDGAVDVSMTALEASLGQAGGFETALRAYVGDCVETSDDCFLGGSVEEGLTTITDLLASIEQEPLPVADGRELAVGDAFYGLITPLYARDYWTILSQALQQALDGDGTTLMLLADTYASREDGAYADNSSEAILAINCLDDPTSVAPARVPSLYDDFEKVSPTFGRVFAWGMVGCRGIRVRSSEKRLDVRAEGAAPILVTGTTRDPATPYEWAVALADQLESGVLVTRDGDGHTAYNSDNPCVDEAIEAYLFDGTVPEDGLRC